MGQIKIIIEESGKPITGLNITDFENVPSGWTDIEEIEPGVYIPVIKDDELVDRGIL